jgi:ADP-ribose pyrophosphatase
MRQIFEGKHVLVLEHDAWEFVERKKGKSAVVILAVTDDDRVILIEQLRRPVGARVIDFPAGLVGDEDGHEDPEETAKRELQEETGYACETVERLTAGPTSPGITSEIVAFYRARGLSRIGAGGGVDGEDITVHLVPRGDLDEWLRRKAGEGALIDVKIWAGLWWLAR